MSGAALTFILALSRSLLAKDRLTREGRWEQAAREAATPAVNFQFERALRQTPGFGKSAPRGYEEYEAAMREMGDG